VSAWGIFWITWWAVGILGEVVALINKTPGDTLSEQVWHLRENMSGNVFSLSLFLLGGLALWAIYHFAFQDVGS